MTKQLEAARRDLEKAALAYALMKAFSCHLDNEGRRCIVGSDRSRYLELFTQHMQAAAETLLIELQHVAEAIVLKDKP